MRYAAMSRGKAALRRCHACTAASVMFCMASSPAATSLPATGCSRLCSPVGGQGMQTLWTMMLNGADGDYAGLRTAVDVVT